jgi:hypothetical protein
MKVQSLVLVLGMLSSGMAMARRGGESSDPGRAARGTAAWFVGESAELTVQSLIASAQLKDSEILAVNAQLQSAALVHVGISSEVGELAKDCQMFDEWSRSGTVLKKEVVCGNVASAARLTRGSLAWFLLESIEHAARTEMVANASFAQSLAGVSSVLSQDKATATVIFNDADSLISQWTCMMVQDLSNGGTTTKVDVLCRKI